VSGSTGVRLRAPVVGREVTTSGSSRLVSAWSIAATTAGGDKESIGFEKTRLPSLPQTGQAIDVGGAPSGRATSNTPSSSHRYS
jgi:hypothetical protein